MRDEHVERGGSGKHGNARHTETYITEVTAHGNEKHTSTFLTAVSAHGNEKHTSNFTQFVVNEPSAYHVVASVGSAGWTGLTFSGLINGAPSATSVVYDTETGLFPGGGACGRIVLRNTTRGTSRIVTSYNAGTKTFTTVSTADAWANNDVITCFSAAIGATYDDYFFDVDLSDIVPAAALAVLLSVKMEANNPAAFPDYDQHIVVHPYCAYNELKARDLYLPYDFFIVDRDMVVKNYSQKICVRLGGEYGIYHVAVRGWWL